MKYIYITLIFVALLGNVFTQTKLSVELTPIEKLRIKANKQFKLGEITEAKNTFEKIIKSTDSTDEDVVNYALVLQELGAYDEAAVWFTKFNELNPSDSRGNAFSNSLDVIKTLSEDNENFTIKHLDINTSFEDFSAVFYFDKVLFASSRKLAKPINKRWKDNMLPFLDIYQADMDEDFDLKNIVPFDIDLNKNYHDGPISFNKDYTEMYITTDNYTGQSSEGVIKLKLFRRKMIDGEWSEKEPVAYNSDEYSIGHATVSDDNKWLFFSSSIDGGLGSVDIYKARIYEDGTYGNPVNLGSTINTEGKEMFPYINKDILYYSSNGKVGLGGLDIFAVQLIDGTVVGEPINLGSPINSNRDDFSFVLHKEKLGGYFSSNRAKGEGSDDIYSFTMEEPLKLSKVLKGLTVNKFEDIVPNTLVELLDANNEIIATTVSDEDGNYSFSIENDKNYNLTGKKESYSNGMNTVSSFAEDQIILANIEMVEAAALWLDISAYDATTSEKLENVNIQLVNKITGEITSYTIPDNENFILNLEDNKLFDPAKFDINFTKEGYLTENFAYSFAYNTPGAYVIKENLKRVNVGQDLNKIIEINSIYFDLDKHNIRPDARIELDKIVKVMNENPNMVIELGSHTDCRASSKYNQSLSQRRAKSSANYIKSRIPNPENIYGKGYGETMLLNNCACEDDVKSDCSENEHQLNRRTEFIIKKM